MIPEDDDTIELHNQVAYNLMLRSRWDQIHVGLKEGAGRAAQRALQAREDSDWGAFILHAGMAIELLAKSILAHIDPLLIADNEDTIMLLAMGESPLNHPRTMKTVSLTKALARLDGLGRGLGPETREIAASLQDAKNAIMHMGLDNQLGRRAGPAWALAMITLIDCHPDCDRESIFSTDRTAAVRSMLDKYDSVSQQLLTERITQAQERWSSLQTSLNPDAMRRHQAAAAANVEATRDGRPNRLIVPCPVCASDCVVIVWTQSRPVLGHIEIQDPLTGESKPSPDIVGIGYELHPSSLRCFTCDLTLDTGRLVKRADVFDPTIVPWEERKQIDLLQHDEYYDQLGDEILDWETELGAST